MPRYRVEFNRQWIMGRWGFTDRVMHQLGGGPVKARKLDEAWEVPFKGTAAQLGQALQRQLNIQPRDFEAFGTLFDIEQV